MGVTIKINNAKLKEKVELVKNRVVDKYSKAGMKAMEELRTGAVSTWYHNGKPKEEHSINIATQYTYSTRTSNYFTTITITSFVNTNILDFMNAYPKVREWEKKHKVDGWTYRNGEPQKKIDMTMTPSQYVVHKQWELGILGLPQKGSFTPWVNPKFVQRQPMEEAVKSNFSNEKWNDMVNRYANQ